MRASPPNLVRKWRTPSERKGREQEGLSMISTTELEQEIARRESRLVEGERFRRAAPVAGMVLAFAAIVVEFAVLMASASMEEAIRVLVSAAVLLAGTFGLGSCCWGCSRTRSRSTCAAISPSRSLPRRRAKDKMGKACKITDMYNKRLEISLRRGIRRGAGRGGLSGRRIP